MGIVRTTIPRGIALFLGVFSTLNLIADAAGRGANADLWWIDRSAFAPYLAVPLAIAAAVLLTLWGATGRSGGWLGRATGAAAAGLAVVALENALVFYRAWASGSIDPGAPVPFSAFVCAALAWIALAARSGPRSVRDAPPRRLATMTGLPAVLATAVAAALLFPLAHVWSFGLTDYRRPAEAAVVFGARVYADGALSWSLRERVDTAIGLYDAGMVETLVFSGATGESGVDEADAMRAYAVERGVDPDDIMCDHRGLDTDATVANTIGAQGAPDDGRLIAVSHFYHLPRIKMAYRAAGVDVLTVPARWQRPISGTPRFVAREVPGFWWYWARSCLGVRSS